MRVNDSPTKIRMWYNVSKGNMYKNHSSPFAKRFFAVVVIQTSIIMVAIGLLYWWQLSVTDAIVDRNITTIQSLQRQVVNMEQQLKTMKMKAGF